MDGGGPGPRQGHRHSCCSGGAHADSTIVLHGDALLVLSFDADPMTAAAITANAGSAAAATVMAAAATAAAAAAGGLGKV